MSKQTLAETDGTRRLCRLSGWSRGQRLSYLLVPGENVVGFLPGSTIVLPFPGVSRRHARLRWDGTRLGVEDLGSKNGTRVNGEPTRKAQAGPGDRIDFGPVRLEVEALDPGDVELALRFELARQPADPGQDRETEGLTPSGGGDPKAVETLRFVEGLQLALAPPRPSFHTALALVTERLAASGAALGEWPGRGEPRILATAGDLGTNMEHPGLYRYFARLFAEAEEATVCRAARLPEEPGHCCAGLRRPGAELLACVLRAPERGDDEVAAALEVFLRLVDSLRYPLADRPPPRLASPEGTLAIPLGFVRGVSAEMASVYERIERVRNADFPVLVTGETGTGKEHLVRLLHESSARCHGPFVAVNCAALPAELLEAEMFGIARGVASGVEPRRGRFQEADGGTLFLDELSELPLPLQAKLLRALERREVLPLGGAPVALDVRVVAASNVDLRERIAAGRFRADLFHRVGGFVIEVPPLRRRRADVGPLLEHFLGRTAREAGTWVSGVTLRALELLTRYSWPGNVRELENEVRRLVYLCPAGQPIESAMLAEHFHREASAPDPADRDGSLDLEAHVDELERRLICEALRRTEGQQTEAAKLLGVSRNGLALKMKRLDVRVVGGVGARGSSRSAP